MEQFLKESPSDFNNYDSNNLSPENSNNDNNRNYQNNQDNGDNGNYTNFPNANFNPNYADIGGNNNDNFSLNIEQPYNNLEEFDTNQYGAGTEFFSPGGANNLRSGGGPEFSPSFNGDPFLDDLDNLNYPTNLGNLNPQSPQFNPTQVQAANLDELISPNHQTSILDSQYFSPPGKESINLSSLNGDNTQNNNNNSNNTFSPNLSRHGSVSVPFQNTNNYDVNTGSYLSPQQNSFMSPGSTNFENSLDTLRSPNFGSYLNSPPQYNPQHRRNISEQLTSTSNPNNTNNFLSPPNNTSTLGTSAPGGNSITGDSSNNHNVPAKQLSKEEKLKRRREFHNAVERRRRDLIKERIKELGLLVPPSLLNPQLVAVQTFQKNSKLNSKEINDLLTSVKVKESKPNKSTILNKSVDYVIHLQYVLEQQQKTRAQLEQKIKALESNYKAAPAPVEDPSPNDFNTSFDPSGDPNADVQLQQQQQRQPQNNANFLQDFQNQSQSQYIKQEDSFNPDEFFLEIITGNDQNNGYR